MQREEQDQAAGEDCDFCFWCKELGVGMNHSGADAR